MHHALRIRTMTEMIKMTRFMHSLFNSPFFEYLSVRMLAVTFRSQAIKGNRGHSRADLCFAENEIELAARLFALTRQDARIGYEASNHYYYYPLDLVEKVVNCRYVLDHWLPEKQAASQ